MCPDKDVLRLCQAGSCLGPGSDSVFAELPVRVTAWPVVGAWHLDSI